jgi:hypothetical protein
LWGIEGRAPHIFNIGARWRLVLHAVKQPSYTPTYLLHTWTHDVPLLVWTCWLRQISCPWRESSRSQSLLSWLCFCTSFWRCCTYKISTSIGQSPYIPIDIVRDFP